MRDLSKCRATGFLHDFQIAEVYDQGVMEVCLKCRMFKFFHNLTPNRTYLAYHMRSLLQPSNPRFAHEYDTIF